MLRHPLHAVCGCVYVWELFCVYDSTYVWAYMCTIISLCAVKLVMVWSDAVKAVNHHTFIMKKSRVNWYFWTFEK